MRDEKELETQLDEINNLLFDDIEDFLGLKIQIELERNLFIQNRLTEQEFYQKEIIQVKDDGNLSFIHGYLMGAFIDSLVGSVLIRVERDSFRRVERVELMMV